MGEPYPTTSMRLSPNALRAAATLIVKFSPMFRSRTHLLEWALPFLETMFCTEGILPKVERAFQDADCMFFVAQTKPGPMRAVSEGERLSSASGGRAVTRLRLAANGVAGACLPSFPTAWRKIA